MDVTFETLPQLAAMVTALLVIVGVIVKPWRWLQTWRLAEAAKDTARHESLRVELHAAATSAADALAAKLMAPNHGNSLFDVARGVEHLTEQVKGLHSRTDRLERQVDEVLIPRQADVMRSVGLTRRRTDSPIEHRKDDTDENPPILG